MLTIEVTPLDDGVTALNCRGRVWAYVIHSRGAFALFDTGFAGDDADLFAALQPLGGLDALTAVVVSHGHADHAGGIASLLERSRAVSYAHRLDAPVIRGEASPPPPDLTDRERPIFEAVTRDVPDAPAARVDHELEDGDLIDIGGPAEVVHVPGHTPGSIALYLPGRRALLTGDAVAGMAGGAVLGFFNADRAAAISSLRRLSELDFDIAGFGHGPPLLKGGSEAFRRAVAAP
ncbi:MAG: MBL fold metallo-hydrolase [Dehalococcoidia bacterium]